MSTASKSLTFTLYVLIILSTALSVRLLGIGSFMTVDEENWMLRSGDFYHNFFDQIDPGGTFNTTHPGATTQWLAGAGIYWQEHRLSEAIDTSNLIHFRKAATIPIALATSVLILISTCLVAILMGRQVAFWAGILLATEPFLVGSSQIVHLDMLLGLFMLNATLSLFVFLDKKKIIWLVSAGSLTGAAFATKFLPSLWLPVFFGLVLLQKSKLMWRLKDKKIMPVLYSLKFFISRLFFVLGISLLIFWLLWPALWVKYGLGSYFERDVISVTTQDHVSVEQASTPINPATFYVRSFLGRTTPFTLLLACGAILLLLKYQIYSALLRHYIGQLPRHDKKRSDKMHVSTYHLGWFAVYIIGFLIVITLAAKKADRYAIPALVFLPVLAGSVFPIAIRAMQDKIKLLNQVIYLNLIKSFIIFALLFQLLSLAPYAISYNNQYFNLRPLSQQGWGEGLDAAARWLNNHPLADKLTIASWYPAVTGTYFHGKTMSLSSRDDDRVGMVITYRNMQGRSPDDAATDIFNEFSKQTPAHVISIDNREYVWIYEKLGLAYFPGNVGELIRGMEVGQKIYPLHNWDRIAIGISNFSSRANSHDVILSIKNSPDEKEILRQVIINASALTDQSWHQFQFEPLPGNGQRSYYISLTSPESVPGNAITVHFVDQDILKGEMLLRRKPLVNGQKNSHFYDSSRDLAYRLNH